MTTVLALPFALLLVVSGFEKLRSPSGAHAALAILGIRNDPVLARALPAFEIAVGAAFTLAGGRVTGVLLVLTYLGFSVLVARELWRGSRASCGCFGERSGELSVVHLMVNLLAVGMGSAAVVGGGGSPMGAMVSLELLAPAAGMAIITATGLLRAMLVDLPAASRLSRSREVSA